MINTNLILDFFLTSFDVVPCEYHINVVSDLMEIFNGG